jgi:Domain of unknown function (DUF4145)
VLRIFVKCLTANDIACLAHRSDRARDFNNDENAVTRTPTKYVPKTITIDCPRCNAIVGAPVLGHYSYLQDGPDVPVRYLFARCPGCDAPMVAAQENYGDWDNDLHFDEPSRVLPRPSRAEAAVPRAVANAYDEAARCLGARAYAASAIMCRKALEALVKEHQIASPNLAAALKAMREQGLIEARLFEWADALRLAGNDAAHDVEGSMSREDARDTLDFTGALVEYVFTFRDRFEEFKRRRETRRTTKKRAPTEPEPRSEPGPDAAIDAPAT